LTPKIQVLSWIFALFFSAGVTWWVRKNATLDIPSDRSMHKVPTPRGGGLGIVVAFVIAGGFLALEDENILRLFVPMLFGAIPVAVVGWLDDRFSVPAKWRALVHVISCFLSFYIYSAMSRPSIAFMLWPWILLATIGAAYFLNIFNFMDGLDGLAGSEAAFVGVVVNAIYHGEVPLRSITQSAIPATFVRSIPDSSRALYALLGFCCIGFLIWNWPPAKIFMGDVGSGFLGFALAYFALTRYTQQATSIWLWLILLAVFIVDGTVTLVTRFATGQKWYDAHNLHAFQKAAKRAGRHIWVTLGILAINFLWLLPLGMYAESHQENGLPITALAYAPLIIIALLFRAGRKEPSATDSFAKAQ